MCAAARRNKKITASVLFLSYNGNNTCMATEKYGFTGKVTEHSSGLYLRIPDLTAESSGLEDKDLLELTIRSMDGQEVEVSRKVRESGGHFKVYLPQGVREKLGLGHKDLVDVFFSKD